MWWTGAGGPYLMDGAALVVWCTEFLSAPVARRYFILARCLSRQCNERE